MADYPDSFQNVADYFSSILKPTHFLHGKQGVKTGRPEASQGRRGSRS
jgi:hypothetical protein